MKNIDIKELLTQRGRQMLAALLVTATCLGVLTASPASADTGDTTRRDHLLCGVAKKTSTGWDGAYIVLGRNSFTHLSHEESCNRFVADYNTVSYSYNNATMHLVGYCGQDTTEEAHQQICSDYGMRITRDDVTNPVRLVWAKDECVVDLEMPGSTTYKAHAACTAIEFDY